MYVYTHMLYENASDCASFMASAWGLSGSTLPEVPEVAGSSPHGGGGCRNPSLATCGISGISASGSSGLSGSLASPFLSAHTETLQTCSKHIHTHTHTHTHISGVSGFTFLVGAYSLAAAALPQHLSCRYEALSYSCMRP